MLFENRMRVVGCIGLLMLTLSVYGQENPQPKATVNARFESDSISVGKVIPYSLTARYSKAEQLIFPDSTFSFAPFEFSKKIFFPTKTTGDVSYDSVVYWLTTFEIDSIQKLRLPVFVIQQMDCVAVLSPFDSVRLNFRVAAMPDSTKAQNLPLKTNTIYQRVSWIFNYPVAAIITGILLLVVIVCWILFGKRIRKYFAIKKLTREYNEFIARFNKSLDQLSSEFNGRKAEDALIIWKGYMEDLERYPYTKFTSREIIRRENDDQLGNALRSIDRGIYGGLSSSLEPFRFLQTYSQTRFQKKEAEVKNG
ncbi:MAG: hypothetical protein HOP08_19500 [Cyclobacteriaceae bacterium]|nr:hypothetical protein [Cyclobacteriaceae bacterium]